MPYTLSVASHILLGSIAIALYWSALLAVKGSRRHRRAGTVFFGLLIAVALSVGPMLLLRPGVFDPAYVVQFVYLALCLVTVATLGYTAIRWKGDLARFRGRHFKILGVSIFVLAIVVLAAGVAEGKVLTMIFSWVGLFYGGTMIRFAWMGAEVHPRWPMIWHLNAVSGLFNAAHGTFLAISWRTLVDPGRDDEVAIAFQILTIAAGLGLRLWYGQRRGIPWRFARGPAASGPAAAHA